MDIPQTLIVPSDWAMTQETADWLTPREQAICAASSSPRRRADRVAGRFALKRLLWETFDIMPLAYEIGSEGPAPVLVGWKGPRGLTVSLSHSAGTGAASWSWSREEGTVGIDIQHIRPVNPALRQRALAESEQRQQEGDILLFWTLKEAAIKARRQAWGRAMTEIVVTLNQRTAQIDIADELPMTACYVREGNWWLARVLKTNEEINGEGQADG